MRTERAPRTLAVDADVVIYASADAHAFAETLTRVFASRELALIGSTLLTPEVLSKPTREGDAEAVKRCRTRLSRVQLKHATSQVCDVAMTLGATYKLRTIDAVHLATAVVHGADAFLTNNRKDFRPEAIEEIAVIFPDSPVLVTT